MAGSGDVDPMVPGRRIVAIYVFCDIRNFTDAWGFIGRLFFLMNLFFTTDVMIFVNNLADILHSLVDKF